MVVSMITFVSPLLGLIMILSYIFKNWKSTEYKNLKKFVFPLAFIFAVFGYSMAFGVRETDLTRYYQMVNFMKTDSLRSVLLSDADFLYTKDILFYFVSRTNNVNILAFLVGLIIYSIVFYVLFDMVENSDKRFKIYEIFMLGIISVGIISPYSIIGNVRCILAYSTISFATYRDLVQKKRNIFTLILYIIPIGLHTSAIIIIVIRILSQLLRKFNKLAIVVTITLPKIIDLVHDKLGHIGFGAIGQLITNAINKAYSYLHWTEGGWATKIESSISNKFFRFAGAMFLIAIIFSIFIYNYGKDNRGNRTAKYPMINYLYFIAIFALGTLSIKTGAFWRFESIVVLFSPIIFVKILESNDNFNQFFNIFSVFGLILFFINIIYEFRNIDTLQTIINFISTSGIKILYDLVVGIVNII